MMGENLVSIPLQTTIKTGPAPAATSLVPRGPRLHLRALAAEAWGSGPWFQPLCDFTPLSLSCLSDEMGWTRPNPQPCRWDLMR